MAFAQVITRALIGLTLIGVLPALPASAQTYAPASAPAQHDLPQVPTAKVGPAGTPLMTVIPGRAEATVAVPPAIPSAPLPIAITADGARGPGRTWLAAAAAAAQFFLVGDEPGVAETAWLLSALMPDLDRAGYRAYALEIGPWMAANLEDIARRGGDEYDRFVTDPSIAAQVPVVSLAEEAALARAAITWWADRPRVLWGIDQEFLTSAPFLLDRLASFATSAEQRRTIAGYRVTAAAEAYYLATAPDQVFMHLAALFPDGPAEARALVEEMALAKHIYGPFVVGSAAMSKAKARRELLLGDNFLRFWREAMERTGAETRVLVKLTADHLARQRSTPGLVPVGEFLDAMAAGQKGRTFALAVVCGPRGKTRLASGGVRGCDGSFTAHFGALQRFLADDGSAVVVPTGLIGEVKDDILAPLVAGYDAILVLPGATAATPTFSAIAMAPDNR